MTGPAQESIVGIGSRLRNACFVSTACVALAAPGTGAEEPAGDKAKVASGKKVSIEYTLRLDDGTQADSNVGGEPLVYEQGASQILPALEQALAGLSVNDTRHVTLTPEQGYGPVDPSATKEVALSEIPEEARRVDAVLIGVDAEGNQRPVRVQKVAAEKITLDLNHPLAGRTLTFDVKILKIE
jgi:FKBP-type peptidyl-prolyl cis-trans isomerase 2